MSKYEIFMKTTLLNKIKKCKEMYKYLPKHHGTIIAINYILIELENSGWKFTTNNYLIDVETVYILVKKILLLKIKIYLFQD